MNWSSVISGMEYPHWLMAAGGVMVVVGYVGFAFQRNTEPAEGQEIAPPEERSHLRPLPARPLSPSPPFELDPRD
jgi:hypothetical protein